MLSDPNDDSPANIDAAVMWRDDRYLSISLSI
jgi:ubiquitin-protein ligase